MLDILLKLGIGFHRGVHYFSLCLAVSIARQVLQGLLLLILIFLLLLFLCILIALLLLPLLLDFRYLLGWFWLFRYDNLSVATLA